MAHYSLNDNVITLHRSDGNPSFRPTPDEMIPVRLPDGTINYMHECTGNDPTLKLWKVKIGTFLANNVLQLPYRRQYILSSLPRGYSLWVHKKGDKYNPRTDAYLRGSSTVPVFRSPAEFFFHAKWILLGCPKPSASSSSALQKSEELFGPTLPEEYTDRCGCTYCAGVSQNYISRTFSNYHPKGKPQRTERVIQPMFRGTQHPRLQ